jgi:hypothetical protein
MDHSPNGCTLPLSHGDLEEEVYIAKSSCKRGKSIYCESGRQHDKVQTCSQSLVCKKKDQHFKAKSFKRNPSNSNLYIVIKSDDYIVIMVLYVDGLIVAGNNTPMIKELKDELHKAFQMTNLSLLHIVFRV